MTYSFNVQKRPNGSFRYMIFVHTIGGEMRYVCEDGGFHNRPQARTGAKSRLDDIGREALGV